MENPNIKELLKSKVDSFEIEELEARLEQKQWFDDVIVNISCKASAEVPTEGGEEPTEGLA
jgi:hypothetical protein